MSPRAQITVALIATFLFGVSAGALGAIGVTLAMRHHGEPFAGRDRPVRYRMHGPGPMALDLERRLDLTPEQAERFRAVLESSSRRFEALRDSTEAALARELTAEQRVEYHRMERHFVRHRRLDGSPRLRRDHHRAPWEPDSNRRGERR